MEAKATLVWSDGIVELDSIATIDVDLSCIVHPRNPELEHAVRFDHAVDDAIGAIVRVPIEHRFQGNNALFDGLEKLGLPGILLREGMHEFRHERGT